MNLPALLISLAILNLAGPDNSFPARDAIIVQNDTVRSNQVLFNGRIWRNLHHRVYGTQFFFTSDFLTADVAIMGQTYKDISVKYDIFADELLARTNHGLIIQLNKEHVDSFSLNYLNRVYNFVRIDSAQEYSGYVNVVYSGRSNIMYVKYRKFIELLAIDRKQDRFYETRKMYLVRNGVAEQFSGRGDLLRLFGDHKKEIKTYIKTNKLQFSKDNVQSYVPAIEYYDKLLSGTSQ